MERPLVLKLIGAKVSSVLFLVALCVGAVQNTSTVGAAQPQEPSAVADGLRAGLRASNYGISPFPSPTWWVSSIQSMSGRFQPSTGEQVAVVVEVSGGGGKNDCWAHFPDPSPGTAKPNVVFDSTDLFESTFAAFDQAGIKVWVQVEEAVRSAEDDR